MHIALALRRKRDEIAATIADYEARIDAATMDLAALDQATRLFDLENSRDETTVHRELAKPHETPAPPREARALEPPLATGQLTLPVVAATEGIPEEFFYLDWP
jgi:hypothetical protein